MMDEHWQRNALEYQVVMWQKVCGQSVEFLQLHLEYKMRRGYTPLNLIRQKPKLLLGYPCQTDASQSDFSVSGCEIGSQGSLEIVINGILMKTYIGRHITTVEWCIGEELVFFREDPFSRLQEGKFQNLITEENYFQRTLKAHFQV